MFQEIIGSIQTGVEPALCASECFTYCANSCTYCTGVELLKAEVRAVERSDLLTVIRDET